MPAEHNGMLIAVEVYLKRWILRRFQNENGNGKEANRSPSKAHTPVPTILVSSDPP